MPFACRSFLPADLDACVTLFVQTFARETWNEAWEPAVVRSRLEQIIHTPGFFGAIIEDEGIAGFVMGFSEPWHEGSHFYIKEMCISADFQRQGLGTRLMGYLMEETRNRDTRRFYLLTARGDMSEAFYAKLGFYTSPKMILMARRFS